MNNTEEWRDVAGYETLYAVSSIGRIMSKPEWRDKGANRIMKGGLSEAGYPLITLCRDGKRKTFGVHRLVATAFIPNPDGKPVVNHKNFIPTDNSISNLEWVTASENKTHYIQGRYSGTHPLCRQPRTEFQATLNALVSKTGTEKAALLCGVDIRTIQRWLKGPPPNLATQAGAIQILGSNQPDQDASHDQPTLGAK